MKRIQGVRSKTAAVAALLAVIVAACGGGDGGGSSDAPPLPAPAAPAAPESEPEPTTLSVVFPFPVAAIEHDGFRHFVELAGEYAPSVSFDLRGGPEVIPQDQIGEALQDGIIDLSPLPGPYLEGPLPILQSFILSPFSPMEEREGGVFDYFSAAFEAAGLKYLGKAYSNVPARLFVNKEITSADLSGITFRVSGTQRPAVEGNGGTAVALPIPEVYTALQRGAVDGAGWMDIGMMQFGWQEVVKFEIDVPFFQGNTPLLMNLARWNSLHPSVQEGLLRAAQEAESWSYDHYGELVVADREARRAAGVTPIVLPADQQALFAERTRAAAWKELEGRFPQEVPTLRNLFND